VEGRRVSLEGKVAELEGGHDGGSRARRCPRLDEGRMRSRGGRFSSVGRAGSLGSALVWAQQKAGSWVGNKALGRE
jgi:hypothetical protein